MAFKILPIIGMEKEKHVINKIEEQIENLLKIDKKFRELTDMFFSKDDRFERKIDEINDIETRGDEIESEVSRLLFSGAFLPITRGNIFNLVSMLDDICDSYEDASHIFRNLKNRYLPQFVEKRIREIVELNTNGIIVLKKATNHLFGGKNLDEDFEKIKEIEEKIDSIQREIFDYILDNKNRINAKLCWIIGSLTQFIEEVSDNLRRTIKLMSFIKVIKEA